MRYDNVMANKKPALERFMAKIDYVEHCWIWLGAVTNAGYGVFNFYEKTELVHRVSYKIHKGEIGEGLVIDHLCKQKLCVNPDHLEAVTQKVNWYRTDAPKKFIRELTNFCSRGHEYTPENTLRPSYYRGRVCLICKKELARVNSNRYYHAVVKHRKK